jgi:N-acetylglucosamine kinase-like BadF-type ATPase
MIIIADSGSTKTDWVILNDSIEKQTSTIGFNPVFHTTDSIIQNVQSNIELKTIQNQISRLFFYGAGCSSARNKSIIYEALQQCFPLAKIIVGHDLEAAAYATYNDQPHIACILGTGSNSCYFDGKNCIEKTPALGFILGDEASGAYFGKKLITEFLYDNLTSEIASDFTQTYALSLNDIIDKVYRQPNPNVFLASLTPFIHKHISYDLFQGILQEGMHAFLQHHVLCYPEYKDVPVNFVGSIAHHFQESLFESAQNLQVHIDQIIQKPIDGLIKYHREHLL